MIHPFFRWIAIFLSLVVPGTTYGAPVCQGDEGTGAPRVHGVLVGVNDYDHLEDDLRGPVHDVALMSSMLRERFGAEDRDLTRLVSGGAGRSLKPTRELILRELGAMGCRLQAGDLCVVFFAGHGVRVPDSSGDEQDGWDETFLAADANAWDAESRSLPGAITDDEMEVVLASLAATGADVWFLADSCFSGTLERGYSGRSRAINRASLGIPERTEIDSASRNAETSALDGWAGEGAKGHGRMVIFAAAQRDQLAQEVLLEDPLANDGSAVYYGYFTYFLCHELLRGRGISSYRDLIRRVVLRYGAADITGFLPSTDGELDRPIPFYADPGSDPFVAWDGEHIILNLGALDGIAEGAWVSAATKDGDPIGLRVDTVRALDSICSVGPDDVARSPRRTLGFKTPREAKLLSEPDDLRRITVWADPGDADALKMLRGQPCGQWTSPSQQEASAEWSIKSAEGGFLLVASHEPETRYWTSPEGLETTFKSIYAVRNLRRMATHPWVGWLPPGLTVELEVQDSIAGTWHTAAPSGVIWPGQKCQVVVGNDTGDRWRFQWLALGPDQGIVDLGQFEFEPRTRISCGGPLSVNDQTFGHHDLVLLATRSRSESFWHGARPGLKRFSGTKMEATLGIPRSRGPISGRKSSSLGRLLDELTAVTRSPGPAQYEDVEAFVVVFPIQIRWPALPSPRPWRRPESSEALAAAHRFAAHDWPVELPDLERAAWSTDGQRDLIELGGDNVIGWLMDPLGRMVSGENGAAGEVSPRQFTPYFALIQAQSGWVSAYDHNGDGLFDVVLHDENGDLRAETRWERVPGGDGSWTAYRGGLDPLVALTSHLRAKVNGRWQRGLLTQDVIMPALRRYQEVVLSRLALPAGDSGPSRALPEPSVATDDRTVRILDPADHPSAASAISLMDELLTAARSGAAPILVPENTRLDVFDAPFVSAVSNGPRIAITLAMMETLDDDENWVRAVLAHELAHTILGHSQRQNGLSGVHAEALDVRHHFIRQQEFEADQLGAELLERAGHRPGDLQDALLCLHRHQRELGVTWLEGIGSDHGSIMERLARLAPTDARLQALRAFERGNAFLDCRRPDRAVEAFESAIEWEADVRGGLDEVRFALASARIEAYYDALAPDVRAGWLIPDFGPKLTVDDYLGISRGSGIVEADVDRWNKAYAEVTQLPRAMDEAHADLLLGLVLVLHPSSTAPDRARGTEILERLFEDRGRWRAGRGRLYVSVLNNLALALVQSEQVNRAEELMLREMEESAEQMDASRSFFVNLAQIVELSESPPPADVLDTLRGILGTHHVSSPDYGAVARLAKSGALDVDASFFVAPDPGFTQVCEPVSIEIGSLALDLFGTRGRLIAALGQPSIDEAVHPKYEEYRALGWNLSGARERAATDVIALVERGMVVKLTTYRKGSSVTLRARDGSADDARVIRLGDSYSSVVAWLGELPRDEVHRTRASLLSRSNEADQAGLGRSDRWVYIPELFLGLLVEHGTVQGLTLTPAAEHRKSRRQGK